MNQFRGKKVFITGGSSGIGEAAACLLASWGADVWIGARGEAMKRKRLKNRVSRKLLWSYTI